MPRQISRDEYDRKFAVGTNEVIRRTKTALDHALDIRKFEIQLYWTRATYFWTFIGASLAAFGGVQAIQDAERRAQLAVPICCIGIVFSFAWYLVNRGSKQWQENWENHVDLLEDEITGPLYKVVLSRSPAEGFLEKIDSTLTGPAPYSVSKINQIVSLFVLFIWGTLLAALVSEIAKSHAGFPRIFLAQLSLMVMAIVLMALRGRTYRGDYRHIATLRDANIADPPVEEDVSREKP